MILPPTALFPHDMDTDYTLFMVYDTTETVLSKENSPWAKEIDIVPVDVGATEIWADNGFGNINGELFYYDSVERNEHGQVITLKKCMRQLGGTKTQYNKRGTWVRGYVIAEHHNRLVEAVLKTENFIGYNFDPRQETLDWRIRNLQALDVIYDDFNCPDCVFNFNIVEDSPVTGIVANYYITTSLPKAAFEFRLDFGDGNYTTTLLEGQHRYAINAVVDPVITISNDTCEVVQTPIERLTPRQVPIITTSALEVPIPEVPSFPDFTLVPCSVPEPDINLPPLVMPCVSVTPGVNVTGPGISLVSHVTITGPDNPVNITQSTVSITGGGWSSYIYVDMPPIPPTIVVEPPIPPTIVVVSQQSNIALELNAETLPPLEVNWGSPPEMRVNFAMARPVKSSNKLNVDANTIDEFGKEFADLFDASTKMKIDYEPVGIPEEIQILPPSQMPDIRLDASQIPEKIIVDTQEVNIPSEIRIYGPENPIPNTITFDGIPIPERINIHHDIPEEIKVKSTIPEEITLSGVEKIPHQINIELATPLPNTIKVEHDIPQHITLDSLPHTIEITGFPKGIPLLPPETMPPVEMVYRGSPIEVKITMDEIVGKSTGGGQCVMIVPCPG